LAFPYIAMRYRMSKHAFLSHFSLYFLLFGRHPIPPSSIAAQMDQVMDLDSPTTWAKVIAERVALFRRVMPMAMENLSIAQHRNTLRYAHTRGGSYKPKVRQFDVGDFVYLQRQLNNILDTSSSRTILRIKTIRASSVLELQRVDRHTIWHHSKNCVPCHLPNLDPTIITSTWIPPLNYPCQVCQRTDDVDQMLLCNNCNGGYHLLCLKPELTQVPTGIWYCSSCSPAAPWFLLRPCHTFPGLGLGGGDTWEFHLSLLLCIYIYICACIFFLLISFYFWLVLIFLFSRISYGFTPLQHCMSRHYMSRQLSCPYARPHTWWPVMGMPIMSFKVNVRL
jgi:hypothetical protein